MYLWGFGHFYEVLSLYNISDRIIIASRILLVRQMVISEFMVIGDYIDHDVWSSGVSIAHRAFAFSRNGWLPRVFC